MKIRKLALALFGIPKTIYFNFKYFKFKDAVKFPVLISFNTCLKRLSGSVTVKNPKPLGIRIGFDHIGIFSHNGSKAVWEVFGKVIFEGSAKIAHGVKISVYDSGILEIGKNVDINEETSIICRKKIKIGENFLSSWENIIMDTDFHDIIQNGNVINEDSPINIGDNVWIGCRSIVLKGSKIPNGSIIAARSVVTRKHDEEGCIIGGSPAKELRKNVTWDPWTF